MKFFTLLTKLIRARSLNIEQVERVKKKRKKERGQYQDILTEQACKFSWETNAGNPEWPRMAHLARSGSQS